MVVGTLRDVRETIIKLWRERTDTPIDLLESLRGTEVAARNDYSGRVIFEYFQNAIDRAEKSIEIALEIDASGESARLIFANDGKPVTISSGAELPGQAPKSDFHSLCAIFRSDKKPGESIGNKGVGFKSGWEFARRATIASTLASPPESQDKVRWAFRLHQSLDASVLEAGEFWQELAGGPEIDRKLREEVAQRLNLLGKAPSFLFPEFVTDPQTHFDGFDWATTVIVLDGIVGKDRISRLESLVGDFGSARLFFVQQLRNWSPQDICVTSSISRDGSLVKQFHQSTQPPENWTVITAGEATLPGWLARRDELAAEAGSLNFEIKEPSLAIAFPPPQGEEKDADENPLFFCYLPTQVPVPLHGRVHIHGDFLLDIARKNVLDNAYNRGLLKEAARLLVRAVAEESSLHNRDDAASFLSRGSDGQTPAFTEEMEHLLFSEGSEGQDSPWSVTYLKNAFTQEHCSEARHSYALQFVQSWCYQVSREWESTTKDRRARRLRLLAKHALPLIPLSVEQGLVRERADICDAESFNLFLRKRDKLSAAPLKDLDVFASEAFSGVGISTWADLEKFNVFGVREFKFDQVIAVVRRAVSQCFGEKLDPKTESELGFAPGKLLNLIVALRFDEQSDAAARARGPLQFLGKRGTAPTVYQDLAWLPLPVEGEKWLPAFRVLLQSGLPKSEKAPELRDAVLSQGFRVLDEERLESLPALLPLPGAARGIAIEIGAWPCLPLDLRRPDGEIKLVFPVGLAAGDYQVARELFRAVVDAWPIWSAVQPNNERLAGILKELSGEEPWFPLPALSRCVRVPDVVLTKASPIKAEFLYEYRCDRDAEPLLLSELGVRLPEEAAPDRLVRLIQRMAGFSPNADQLRSRYRTLMDSLSKQGFISKEAPKESLPLLVSRDRSLVWRKQLEDRPVWFAGRRHLTWRNYFNTHADLLELRPDVSADWVKSLGVTLFEPVITPQHSGDMKPDEGLRRTFAGILPYLILVAENSRTGSTDVDEEKVLEKWRSLYFKRGFDVSQKVEFAGIERFVGVRTSSDTPQRDVVFVAGNNKGEIWHDLDDPAKELPVFGNALAQALFRNILLADPFEVCLSRSAGERDEWIQERYGVTVDQIRTLHHKIAQQELSCETLDDIVRQVSCLLPLPLDEEAIRSRWWDASFYLDNRVNLSWQELSARLPEAARSVCDLDPTCHNLNEWRTTCKQFSERAARAWFCEHCSGKPELVQELRAKLASADATVFSPGVGAARFDFSPQERLAEILRSEPWVASIGQHESLEQWLKRMESDQVAWLRAEQLEKCAAHQIDVGRWTVACDAPTACFEVETGTHDNVGVNVRKQTQESRQKSDLGKQLRGETAEVLLALKTVSTLLGSGITEERKTALWSELLTNWQKINFTDQAHRDELSVTMPQDPKELLDQLHVAKRLGDGLGFDIISYVEEGDGLLAMVEVKDIGADRIFLSENERLLAVELTKLKVPWRLYGYVQGAGWQDLTKLITDHATEAGTHILSLGLRPKEWELKLKRKQ